MNHKIKTLLVLLAMLASLVIAAGCGGVSQSQLDEAIGTAESEVKTELQQELETNQKSTVATVQAELVDSRKELKTATEELKIAREALGAHPLVLSIEITGTDVITHVYETKISGLEELSEAVRRAGEISGAKEVAEKIEEQLKAGLTITDAVRYALEVTGKVVSPTQEITPLIQALIPTPTTTLTPTAKSEATATPQVPTPTDLAKTGTISCSSEQKENPCANLLGQPDEGWAAPEGAKEQKVTVTLKQASHITQVRFQVATVEGSWPIKGRVLIGDEEVATFDKRLENKAWVEVAGSWHGDRVTFIFEPGAWWQAGWEVQVIGVPAK